MKKVMTATTKRNPVFDMMKGIGILLMIYYHLSCDLRPIIYSFHMPLFFILSGYFAKDISSWDEMRLMTKKSLKRLILPYLVTMILLIVIELVKSFFKGSYDNVILMVLRLAWSSGDIYESNYGLLVLGPLWFLIALFWAREILMFLQMVLRKISENVRPWVLMGGVY